MYHLIMRLYADMPMFHPLAQADFTKLFAPLRQIVDPDLITLAWDGADLVGFAIVLPDLRDLPNRTPTPATLARMLWLRRHYRRQVALYLGSDRPGLGSAMVARMFPVAHGRRVTTVGALIAAGKPTQAYAADWVESTRHYALWTTAV